MPEICEVCLTSQYLSKIIGMFITKITALHGRYVKNDIKGLKNIEFPLKIINIETKGKFLWMTLQNPKKEQIYMMNTFGLTGAWSFEKFKVNNIKIGIKTKNEKLNLYFSDIRNFGTIQFTDDYKIVKSKLDKLAPDILQNDMSEKEFICIVKSPKIQNKKIVIVLMSQEKRNGIISGLGNYLVPEILYYAKLSPHRLISSLSANDIKNLYNSVRYMLRLCYMYNDTKYIEHLSEFLSEHTNNIKNKIFPNYLNDVKISRKTLQFNVYRKKQDLLGNEIIGEEIIKNRTTYWCPSVQK